jgi:hypothetical protein
MIQNPAFDRNFIPSSLAVSHLDFEGANTEQSDLTL